MNVLRKILTSLMAGILSFALFGVAWSNVVIATIHNRDTVKNWFNESKFYEKVVDIALEEMSKAPKDHGQDEGGIPGSDPNVQAVTKQALNPEFLKTNIEKLLDASYDWLDSSSDKLAFSLDLSPAKQQLASGLGDYAKSRFESLPPCGSGESPDSYDAFNSGCRPKGLTADQVRQQVSDEINNSQELLKDPVITPSDIKFKNDQGQEVSLDQSEQAQNIRNAYRLGGMVMYLFSGLALLAALAMVFLHHDKLAGVRRVGYVLISSGVVLLVTYLAMGGVSSWADKQLTGSPDKSAAQKELGADLLRVVFADIKEVLLKYIICFLVLGILAVVAKNVLNRRNHHAAVAKGEKSLSDKITDDKEGAKNPEVDSAPNKEGGEEEADDKAS